MTLKRARNSRRRPSGEGGFALVEVMVSAVVLVAMALGTFSVIDQAGQRSGSNRARGVATSLAEQDQDRMRLMPTASLSDLDETQTRSSNGFDFTIHSVADWVSDSSGVVSCSSTTGGKQYIRITSTVTWPKMNGTEPVILEGFVTPKAADVNKGSLVVLLQNAAGGPQPNVPVTAQSTTRNTDSTGCALFTDMAPGATDISWQKTGYVTPQNDPIGTTTASIVSGSTAVKSGQYDIAATIPIEFRDTTLPTGATGRKWTSATVRSGSNAPVVVPATSSSADCSGAMTGTIVQPVPPSCATTTPNVTGIFPFTIGYSVYAGNCNGNEPTQYGNSNYFISPNYANAFATVTPGGTSATRHAALRRITIAVTRTSITEVGWLVKPDGDTRMAGCENPTIRRTYKAVSTSPTTITLDLPYGLYDICVDSRTSAANSYRSRWMRNTNAANGSATNNTVYYNTPTGSTGANVPGLAAKTANLQTPASNYSTVQCS